MPAQPHQHEPVPRNTESNEPLKSSVALACTVYSLVPYVGILFIPFSVVFGALGYFRKTDARSALLPLVLSVPILAAQLILWWLLYLIPEIGL